MLELESYNVSVPDYDDNGVAIIKIDEYVPYQEFFNNFMSLNKPCVFKSWLTQGWKSRTQWLNPDHSLNIQYMDTNFGSSSVPVADCDNKHYDSQKKETLPFSEYLDYFSQRKKGVQSQKCLYLKDWHFVKDFPNYDAYCTPSYFASDWLNEFWETRSDAEDDYRFVYIGPKGSWTPFHADVFRSYSWSANICGKKRWLFYPPGEEINLRDKFGSLIYDIDLLKKSVGDMYPRASHSDGRCIELIQEEGQTVFVPSNWHHQVWNLEDTVSINHNWMNGTNIHFVWEYLLDSLKEIERSIEDCSSMENWHQQCQLILKATFGMDIKEYFHFLKVIAERRMALLNDSLDLFSFKRWRLGKNHAMYDIQKVIWALEAMLNTLPAEVLQLFEESNHPSLLLEKLNNLISR